MSAAACAAYLSASFRRIYFVRRSPMAPASRWHRAAWALRESLTARIIRRLQRRFFPGKAAEFRRSSDRNCPAGRPSAGNPGPKRHATLIFMRPPPNPVCPTRTLSGIRWDRSKSRRSDPVSEVRLRIGVASAYRSATSSHGTFASGWGLARKAVSPAPHPAGTIGPEHDPAAIERHLISKLCDDLVGPLPRPGCR